MTRKRFNPADLNRIRALPLEKVFQVLGLYYSEDFSYKPVNGKSQRFNVSVNYEVFELIVTNDKWFDTRSGVGGGGSIDLTMHLFSCSFTEAVKTLQDKLGN